MRAQLKEIMEGQKAMDKYIISAPMSSSSVQRQGTMSGPDKGGKGIGKGGVKRISGLIYEET